MRAPRKTLFPVKEQGRVVVDCRRQVQLLNGVGAGFR